MGDGFCGPIENGGAIFNRCHFTTSSSDTTPLASLSNCQARCDATTNCVGLAFKVDSACGLFITGYTGDTCTGGAAGAMAVDAGDTVGSCSALKYTNHAGYECFAIC